MLTFDIANVCVCVGGGGDGGKNEGGLTVGRGKEGKRCG